MAATTQLPNILFILTDQHRHDCLGCAGHPLLQTPNLDRLAKEGMRFDRAYTPIALCSPARASLLTGQYPHRHGIFSNVDDLRGVGVEPRIREPKQTVAAKLARAGYQTGYTGKWHLGPASPLEHGFQRVGLWNDDSQALGRLDDYHRFRTRMKQSIPMQGDNFWKSVVSLPNSEQALLASHDAGPDEFARSYHVAQSGIELIDEFVSLPDKPFFITISFFGPHLPYRSHEPWTSMYRPEDVLPWPGFADTLAGKPFQHQRQREYWNTQGRPWSWWQPIVATYLAYISIIDAQIGRLIKRLEQLGQLDQTLIVFTTDHGDTAGDRGMFDKGFTMYEELYRVPLLARWPGHINPSSVCSSFVSLMDLPCTWLQVAGAPPLDDADGRDLTPLLHGTIPGDWRRRIVSEFHGMQWSLCTQRMIRDERWKFVFNGTDMDELYDLETDPAELHNLSDASEHQIRRQTMRRDLFDLMHRSGDHWARWLSPPPNDSTQG